MYDPTKPYTKEIKQLTSQTWDTPHVRVIDHGIYQEKFKTKYRSAHVDGIGTKYIYDKTVSFKEAAIDSLAMNLNDIILQRSVPYLVTDHITLPYDDHRAIIEMVRSLSDECKKRDIAIVCGEVAVKNTVIDIDISTTIHGIVRHLKPNLFKVGDTLIGFASNGPHSNGYTKIKEVMRDSYFNWYFPPTIIYSDQLLSLEEKVDIHGMVHVTGGAFTKFRPFMQDSSDIEINRNHTLHPQEIFQELSNRGVDDKQMYEIFNCGIGFILSVDKEDVSRVLDNVGDLRACVIGRVVRGNNHINIESMFSHRVVQF